MSRVKESDLHNINSQGGFDVCYTTLDSLIIIKNYFDKKFVLEETAWNFAQEFALKNPLKFLEIFVVYSDSKKPVPNCTIKKIFNYPTI